MPVASISDARRSTVVSSRGSLPGVSTSRGCRSNVTATERTPRSRAASTVRANTARCPRCTPSKNPTVTTDGPSGNGSRSIPSTIRMPASVSGTLSGVCAGARTSDGSERYGGPVGRARARTTMVLLLCLPLTLFACGGQPSDPVTSVLDDDAITVGSFNFPESEVLAEIYAQTLEARGFRVQRELDVGPRELLIPALQRGLVELVPEYAGSLLGFFGGTASSDPATTHQELAVAARTTRTHGAGRRSGRGPQLLRDLGDHGREPQRGAVERPHVVRAGDDVRRSGGMRAAPALSQRTGGRVRPALQGVHRARCRGPADRAGARTTGRSTSACCSRATRRCEPAGWSTCCDDRDLQPVGERHAGGLAGGARDVRPSDSPMPLNAVSALLRTSDLREMNAAMADGAAAADVARGWLRRTASRSRRGRVGRSRGVDDDGRDEAAGDPAQIDHPRIPARVPPRRRPERRAAAAAPPPGADREVLADHGRRTSSSPAIGVLTFPTFARFFERWDTERLRWLVVDPDPVAHRDGARRERARRQLDDPPPPMGDVRGVDRVPSLAAPLRVHRRDHRAGAARVSDRAWGSAGRARWG